MDARPQRIQLKRKKGWNLQRESLALNGLPAVKVTRGPNSKWGNPYPLVNDTPDDRHQCVVLFRRLFECKPSLIRHKVLRIMKGNNGRGEAAILAMRASLHELRGKNLACFCPLDRECHADVLLELANIDTVPKKEG